MALNKVGHFVLGTVVKANPDRDAYLSYIGGTDQLAVLPKDSADGPYRIHDSFYASIKAVGGQYPVLSQRSGHFLRHICNLLLRPLIEEEQIEVKCVATVNHANFAKIAVTAGEGVDPIKLELPYFREFHKYSRLQPSLVRHADTLEQFVRQALVPAPIDHVLRVAILEQERQIQVWVRDETMPRFLGTKGMNVAVASRLVGYKIDLCSDRGAAGGHIHLRRTA